MTAPRVITVDPGSPAQRAGMHIGDELHSIHGEQPRDILEYRNLVDRTPIEFEVRRDGLLFELEVDKPVNEPLGIEVHSALFDEVRTCDNHCEFCFIYQLPPGLRKSLYLKDDDYRLSFLYGNYTTLTRFTEADLERVISERLSPLNVSIHATDPAVRQEMLRNRRGASSLRWLSELLTADIEVHGQVVVCPSLNDGDILDQTLADIADRYRTMETVCVVPLGVSKYSSEERMRAHTPDEANAVIDTVDRWQAVFLELVGHPMVHASDEYYILAGREFPSFEEYGETPMHEDGIGMARTFEAEFTGKSADVVGVQSGFFSWVDAAPAEGYRAPRTCGDEPAVLQIRPRATAPVGILTGSLGAAVLAPLIAAHERDDVRIIAVENEFFGGNVGVSGLMVGADLDRVLHAEPEGHRYLLPDVCLNRGLFLDGTRPEDLPRPVEVIATDGVALRAALERS
ncbi:MAG: DUF512 domain-containing protein [Acidimicrobiales bacterium]|nr:DUF512 domain-containing protein [Acidimicrobiales bacterium]RZV46203.1 MAG: DUF512 domain-containing protein [Acidimicrobiales bacterium]